MKERIETMKLLNLGQIARELHDASYPYGLGTYYLESAALWDKHIKRNGQATRQELVLLYDARGDHCYYTEENLAGAAENYAKARDHAEGAEKQYLDALVHECIGLWLKGLRQWAAAPEYLRKAADLYVSCEPQSENDAKMLLHSALALEGEALYCEARLAAAAVARQLLDRAEACAGKALRLNPLWGKNATSDTPGALLKSIADYRKELTQDEN